MHRDPLTARLRSRLGMISPEIDLDRLRDLHWRATEPLLVAAELLGIEADLAMRWRDERNRPLAYVEIPRASTIRCGHLGLHRNRTAVGEIRLRDPLGAHPVIEVWVAGRRLGEAPADRAEAIEDLAVLMAETLRGRPRGRHARKVEPDTTPARVRWSRLWRWLGGRDRA